MTIAKAGVFVTLNARCSILAAANPVYGQYIDTKPPHINVGMPDSLLSRFDLIFIVLDDRNPEKDKMISRRVTNNHQYIGNQTETYVTSDGFIENDRPEQNKDIYEPYSTLFHRSKND